MKYQTFSASFFDRWILPNGESGKISLGAFLIKSVSGFSATEFLNSINPLSYLNEAYEEYFNQNGDEEFVFLDELH